MTYAYLPGSGQVDAQYQVLPTQKATGHAIGIIELDCAIPFVPGNVSNASTFKFPVMYKVIKGATIPRMLSADPSLLEDIVAVGKELEEQGVRAVVGNCGYFGHFQKEVAKRLTVPTFLSSVLQAPIIIRSLKPDQKLGIVCGSAPHLTPSLLTQCGVEDLSRVAIIGGENCSEFQNIGQVTGHLNSYKIEQEIVGLAKRLVGDNPDIGAILLECTDLPPYAWAIQNAVRLPVFHYITMMNWIYDAVVSRPFTGFM